MGTEAHKAAGAADPVWALDNQLCQAPGGGPAKGIGKSCMQPPGAVGMHEGSSGQAPGEVGRPGGCQTPVGVGTQEGTGQVPGEVGTPEGCTTPGKLGTQEGAAPGELAVGTVEGCQEPGAVGTQKGSATVSQAPGEEYACPAYSHRVVKAR